MLEPLLEAIADPADTVAAIAAIHALGIVPGARAEEVLEGSIAGASPAESAHAIWALDGRPFACRLVDALADAVARGGLAGMHAQWVLARWARTEPGAVLSALDGTLGLTSRAAARRYLTETIGLVPGAAADRTLARIATDVREEVDVRVEAVAAFSDRFAHRVPDAISRLAREDGDVGEAVRMVRARRSLMRRGPGDPGDGRAGITIAQVHLAAVLDAESSNAGAGDHGGVATLLPRLGAALAELPRIRGVITIGRAPARSSRSIPARRERSLPHRFESVALAPGEGATFTGEWPAILAAQRGIRTALMAAPRANIIHLRMADPGSLAAAMVARQLRIDTVFTLAPDPHGPITAGERSGALDRRSFALADARAALWYRVVLAEHLARSSREIVVFPRHDVHREVRELVGIDLDARSSRHTVVSEGIDTRLTDQAARTVAAGRSTPVIAELAEAIGRLPADRHGLPLAVSVGRIHEAKGMARIVEAFAADATLAERANLVIVGGDLHQPTAAEAAELARVEDLLARHPRLVDQVVLLGHRPNAAVSHVLAAARHGWGGVIGPGGAYVCGSPKEEFGLALLEALAAGLPVVAPRVGGPATYVEDGVTGVLVDTTDAAAIARGLRICLELATQAETAARARQVVDERYTLERMARTLAAVYRTALGPGTLAAPQELGPAA